jgi:hypothetical protein
MPTTNHVLKAPFYNKMNCFEKIKFNTEDTKVKHTNIKTIYSFNQNRKYLQK